MLYVSKVDGQDFFSLSKRNGVLLADVKDLFVAIWIKDVLIILGFFSSGVFPLDTSGRV